MNDGEGLRAGFERILERRRRQSDTWRSGVEYPSEYGKGWHDGYTTAMAECALIAMKALDPEGFAEDEDRWSIASYGTDREWFEKTGCCGHCGNLAEDCVCTDDDPCECGPHLERRTWPRDCGWCDGTGKVKPVKRAVSVGVPPSGKDA
jgi:hypothetical protein